MRFGSGDMVRQYAILGMIIAFGYAALPAKAQVSAPADTANAPADSLLDYQRPMYRYESGSARDPFESLAPSVRPGDEEEASKQIRDLFSYEESEVLGIVSSGDDQYALAQDANDLSYVLRAGDRVYGGYVTDITDSAVYLHIVKYGRSMTIILRMGTSKYTEIVESGETTEVTKPGISVSYREGNTDGGDLIIGDVTLTSPYVRTIEEEWYGRISTLPGAETTGGTGSTTAGMFFLSDPPPGSQVALPEIVDWTEAPGDGVTYTLVIDDDPDFTSPVLEVQGITATSFLLRETDGLPVDTMLYWTVRAYDAAGAVMAPYEDMMTFRIVGK